MPTQRIKNYELRIKNSGLKRKTFAFLIVLFTFTFLVLSLSNGLLFNLSVVNAQDASCDLCGWCGKETVNKTRDWENCMLCVFPAKAVKLQITPGKAFSRARPTPENTESYYPSTPEVSKNWTVVGCLDTAPGGFVGQAYKIILAIGSGFAFLAFVYGGFVVLTAGGDPLKVTSGKNIIMGAIFGLLLIIFSVFLLRLIGFEIIKIPGFGTS